MNPQPTPPTAPDATATPRTAIAQVESMLREDFGNHEGWRNHPFVLLARKLANELAAKEAEMATVPRLIGEQNGRLARERHAAVARAETAEAESAQLRAEVEQLGKHTQAANVAVSLLVQECDQLRARVAELQAWKDSALAVEREWDSQNIARLLGASLGSSCRKVINEKVPQLIDRVASLEKDKARLIEVLQAASNHLDYCGYGDSWERQGTEGLQKDIANTLTL